MKNYVLKGGSEMESRSDQELLSRLLRRVQGERTPEETARLLLRHYGSLHSLLECLPMHDNTLPLSANVRMLLTMLPQLCQRRELERFGPNPPLDTLDAAGRYASTLYLGAHYERIYLLCLDEKLRLIRHCLIGEGSLREVPFYPRRLMQEAMRCGAQALILCHNHLSGWCFFSEADLVSTREFLKLCTSIQMPLLDHLLIAGSQINSMRSKAHIPEALWCGTGLLMPPLSQWRTPPAAGRITLLSPSAL